MLVVSAFAQTFSINLMAQVDTIYPIVTVTIPIHSGLCISHDKLEFIIDKEHFDFVRMDNEEFNNKVIFSSRDTIGSNGSLCEY